MKYYNSDDNIIAEQTRRLLNKSAEVKDLRNRLQDIKNMIYNIGGPLNNDINKYSNEQLKIFFDIIKKVEGSD